MAAPQFCTQHLRKKKCFYYAKKYSILGTPEQPGSDGCKYIFKATLSPSSPWAEGDKKLGAHGQISTSSRADFFVVALKGIAQNLIPRHYWEQCYRSNSICNRCGKSQKNIQVIAKKKKRAIRDSAMSIQEVKLEYLVQFQAHHLQRETAKSEKSNGNDKGL